MIEIEDAVLTTIERVIGLDLMSVDIYLRYSGSEGNVILIGRAAIRVNELEKRRREIIDCYPVFPTEISRICLCSIGACFTS